MTRRRGGLALSCGLAVTSCASTAPPTAGEGANLLATASAPPELRMASGSSLTPPPSSAPPVAPPPPSEVIVVHFAACRSAAPAYRLALEADGTVTFDGERNVTSLGKHRAQVDRKLVGDLLARMKAKGLGAMEKRNFGCDPALRRCSIHPCSASLRIVLEGKTHDLTWTNDALPETPLALHEAVTEVERTVNSAQWVAPGP